MIIDDHDMGDVLGRVLDGCLRQQSLIKETNICLVQFYIKSTFYDNYQRLKRRKFTIQHFSMYLDSLISFSTVVALVLSAAVKSTAFNCQCFVLISSSRVQKNKFSNFDDMFCIGKNYLLV